MKKSSINFMKILNFLTLALFLLLLISCQPKLQKDGQSLENLDSEVLKRYALKMAYLSKISYAESSSLDYQIIKEEILKALKNGSETKDLELVWLGVDEDFSNLVFVTRVHTENISFYNVTFRGTILHFDNIFQDLDVFDKTEWDHFRPNLKISSGVHSAIRTIESIKSNDLTLNSDSSPTPQIKLKALIKNHLAQHDKMYLHVTGHSLGGALSTAYTLKLSEEFDTEIKSNKLDVYNVSFAGQTFGDKNFVKYYKSKIKSGEINIFKYINQYDVIPKLLTDMEDIPDLYPNDSFLTYGVISVAVKTVSDVFDSLKYTNIVDATVLGKTFKAANDCPLPFENFNEFICQLTSQHHINNYIQLLKDR